MTGGAPPADPLVLLPGMLGDATVWDGVVAALGPETDVLRPRVDLDDSIAGLASRVLDEAPARFALAGHSLGGIVALEAVRRAPARVTRLALLNTSAGAGSSAQRAGWARLAERVGRGEFAAVAAELARATLPAVHRADPGLVSRNENMAGTVGPDGLRRQLRAQESRIDLHPSLAAIGVPVLVLSGELDEVSPPALQRDLAEPIRTARHETVPGCGHMSPLERPREVAAHLRCWLAR